LATTCNVIVSPYKINKGFFNKHNLTLEFVQKKGTLESAIDEHIINIINLECKISNHGKREVKNAHVWMKIEHLMDDFEQIGEISITRDEHTKIHIATLVPENNEAVVDKKLNKVLEVDKTYHIIIKVTGLNTVKWWFTLKPKSNGKFEYSAPAEIY
jgi:hypothetical protein